MVEDQVNLEAIGPVALVRLNHGATNPIGMRLVSELSGLIREVRDRSDLRSLVLSSASEKFFSIGFDIPNLVTAEEAEFTAFFRAFNRVCLDLFTMPKPTVAAITGHATAGGCILALCCDYRLISEGRKLIGVNEIKLGVPLPYPADCILRGLLGRGAAREVTDRGEFYLPEAARGLGLVDQVTPQEEVVPAAVARAGELGAMPEGAFAAIKRNRVEEIEEQVRNRGEEKEREFLLRWLSEPTRRRLVEAAARF
jgi:enoyl-CoA hydratase/carnithine racemase